MINALANINELAHVRALAKNSAYQKDWKFWQGEAKRNLATPAHIAFKGEQGIEGAVEIEKWLTGGGMEHLDDWESRVPDNFFKDGDTSYRPITIDEVAWTPCGGSFTNFIKKCTNCKGCPATFKGTLHANNPSDALLMVTNREGKKTIIGVSLKATFKNAALTIYNGGVCGFLYLIVAGQDLANKENFCPRGGKPVGVYAAGVPQVIAPYTDFNNELRREVGYPAGTGTVKQKWWKDKVQPAKNTILRRDLIKKKLNALGGVRDNLLAQIKLAWGRIQDNQSTAITMRMTRDNLRLLLAGILQFTHSDVARGGCKVPYVKLTAFGNMTIEIKPPAIEKYLEGGMDVHAGGGDHISVKIVKRGADSLMLCINKVDGFVPYFLIRVKCASRPPGSLKIDIKPVKTPRCVQTGGGREQFLPALENRIQAVPPELYVMLQNLLEDTFDCALPLHTGDSKALGSVVDDVVKEELAACGEDLVPPTPAALKVAVANKYSIIQENIPRHNYSTRQWLDRDFWKKQGELLFQLDKFLFKSPVLSAQQAVSGGSRKRRPNLRKRRKRRYKKRKRKTRRRKTRRRRRARRRKTHRRQTHRRKTRRRIRRAALI